MKRTLFPTLFGPQIILVIALFSGCATPWTESVGLHVELISGGGLKLRGVSFRRLEAGVRISGTVTRTSAYPNSAQRQLDMEVAGPDHIILQTTKITFFPAANISARSGSSRSTYTFLLPSVPAPGSTIRISVPR